MSSCLCLFALALALCLSASATVVLTDANSDAAICLMSHQWHNSSSVENKTLDLSATSSITLQFSSKNAFSMSGSASLKLNSSTCVATVNGHGSWAVSDASVLNSTKTTWGTLNVTFQDCPVTYSSKNCLFTVNCTDIIQPSTPFALSSGCSQLRIAASQSVPGSGEIFSPVTSSHAWMFIAIVVGVLVVLAVVIVLFVACRKSGGYQSIN